MEQILDIKEVELDEDYLLFVGYDYSPSGFAIGTFNLSGYFELHNGLPKEFNDVKVFELPKISDYAKS